MDQEFSIGKSSRGRKMQDEQFQSKNSSFTKFKLSKNQLINLSNKSSHSMKNQGTNDLLKNLSGSDPVKMIEQLQGSMKSSNGKNRPNFLHNSNQSQDKAKLGSMSFQIDEKWAQNQFSEEITHQCDCKLFGKNMYCPKYCVCYNKPERCSKIKCCLDCFQVKQMRLKAILQESEKQFLSTTKRGEVDVGIYIEGVKKAPKKFREQKCQCRNSRCENKYCVCFTAGNKCSVKCLCQNCKNSDFINGSKDSIQSKSKNMKPYLEGSSNSNETLSQKMQFEPPFLPF